MDKLGHGDAVSRPLPRAWGSERERATSSRSTSEAAIRRDFNARKRSHGKGREEHYAKTAQMTTAALNDNLDSQVNQACAIAALQDETDCRDEEMDDAERSEREVIRKPRVPTSTSALSHAMLAAGAMSVADPPDAVQISATDLMPRLVSAFGIAGLTASLQLAWWTLYTV